MSKSVENQVYKLEKELRFWERVHEHEPMDATEFKLIEQIEQLENRDSHGIPRYNGVIHEDDDEDEYYPSISYVTCRYCHTPYLTWKNISGKWRLCGTGGIHTCKQYTRK